MAEASNASPSSKGQPEKQHHQHQTAQPDSLPAAKQGYFLAQLHDGAASWMPVAIPAEDMPPSPVPGLRRIRFQVQPSGNRELRIRSANWLASRPKASMPATEWPVPLHMMPKLELQASESLSADALLLEASPAEQTPAGSPGCMAALPGNTGQIAHQPQSQVRLDSAPVPYSQLSASERWNAVTSAQPPYALNSSYRSRLQQSPAGQSPANSLLNGAAFQSHSYAGVYPNQQVAAANALSRQQPSAAMQHLQVSAGNGKLPCLVVQQPADQETGRCESGSAHSSQEATAQPHSHPDNSSLAASGPLGLKLDPARVLASAGLPVQPGPAASSPGVARQSTKSSPKAVPASPEVDQQLAGSRASSEVSERAGHKRARSVEEPSEPKALKQSHGASPQQSSPPDKGFGRGAIPYRGVRRRAWGTFSSEIRDGNGNRKWLGTFATALEAAQAYDTAARKIPGAAKRCNFPQGDPGPVSPGVVTAKHPGAAVEYKTALPKADPKPAPTGPRDIPSPATEDAPETSNQDQGPAGVSEKICSRCKVLKSASDFTRDRYNRDMLSPCCRECARIKLTAMRQKRRQENAQAKTVDVPVVKDPSTNTPVTFFVEKVLGYRKHPDCPRLLQFKVHWWGYPASEDTWEPSTNLADAPLTYPWESDAKKANATKLLEEGYE